MTRLAEALAERLSQLEMPIISDCNLFLETIKIYKAGKTKYLRGKWPSLETYRRTRNILVEARVIEHDKDYGQLWRIFSSSDRPADEIVCIADPFCYISHISAMQKYGLTDRRPEALFLTQPKPSWARSAIGERVRSYLADLDDSEDIEHPSITATHHPERVRLRPIKTKVATHFGDWRNVRGTAARVSSIGQTFLDMVDDPARCGGMLHVLKTWENHARTYLEEIINCIDAAPKPIHKVRAGYILEKHLGVVDHKIIKWKKFAQRGGSRVLSPGEPFVDRYSDDWMISINVG